ncbi:CopD family protein [uncultured Roseobacter sp.]|uniref:CopD family protein n=1 Tax=uncultured Roseobacter sp. TaxID=114847 RepID=UPI00262A32C8|nr:CopD family protein [uncultured Roseobacter sp.]
MLVTLATVDTVTWLSIIVKAFAYAATLFAVGSVLVVVSLQGVSERGRAALRRTAVLSALAAAVFTGLRLPVRASFLMGSTWDGAVEPMILGMVAESPLGTSAAVRLAGLALIFCILWRARAGRILAVVGACLASGSFALRGHALGEPQMMLGALITLHILCLAFWVGAFAPLVRATRRDPPAIAGALAHEFGRRALWVVGLLVVAGGLALVLLGAATPSALFSPYGQMFAIKLVLFAGVLTLAAVNKLKLTPALLASTPGTRRRFRRSIGFEVALVAGILVTTAALTTVSSPPGDGESEQASLGTRPAASARHTFGDAS